MDNITKFVFVDNFLLDVVNVEYDVFRAFHWSIEIKIGDIHCRQLICSRSRNNTIEENFGNQHVRCWCSDFPWIFNPITLNDKTGSVWFLLLGSDSADKRAIRHVFMTVLWDSTFWNELDSVDAFDSATYTVCQLRCKPDAEGVGGN